MLVNVQRNKQKIKQIKQLASHSPALCAYGQNVYRFFYLFISDAK